MTTASGDAGPLTLSEMVDDHILRITLNNPRAYNALSLAMVRALDDALEAAAAEKRARVIIIAANGRGFCAGHDLKELHAHHCGDPDRGHAFFVELFDAFTKTAMGIVNSPKVVIAQVQGIATAAGAQLVASCDMAVAAREARFGVNGVSSGLFCSTPMVAVSRAIGRKKTMELLTTGRLMDAEEARQAGLINHVTAAERLEEETLKLARLVAEKSMKVVAMGKRAFHRQVEMSLEDAYAYTRGVIVETLMTEDCAEGVRAFVEKRRPQWKDR